MNAQVAPGRWRIPLPTPEANGGAPLSSNARKHWSVRHKIHAWWRHTAALCIRAAGVPPLPRCHLVLHVIPPDRRERDDDNIVAHVLKPIKDALGTTPPSARSRYRDAGVVPKDLPRYVSWQLILEPPDGTKRWGYWIELEERPADHG